MASILIIDDDQTTRVLLGAAIEEIGHAATYASDGKLGVGLFQERPYDIVIMDLAMPVLNGLLAIQQIIANFPDAKIIAISGIDAIELDLAEEYGATKTLMKPVDPKQLQDIVQAVLSGDAWSNDLYQL